MKHNSKLETRSFCIPLFIKKKDTREKILQINHKHEFSTKYLNKKTDTSGYGPPKATFQHHPTKVN